MLRICCMSGVAMSLGLSACSIHPLPKDVSKTDTLQIVRNMRCEAKFEAKKVIAEYLRKSPSPRVRRIPVLDVLKKPNLRIMEEEFNKEPKFTDENGMKQDYNNLFFLFKLFENSAISYSFTFEITENNGADGSLSFRLPFTNGRANFFGGASVEKSRVGIREFTMVESFGDLRKLECKIVKDAEGNKRNVFFGPNETYEPLRKKFIYPLTGSVSMDKIMRDFLELGALGGGKGTLSDTIRFTTSAEGNIGADVTLNPGRLNRFRLARAAVNGRAGRQDIHQVVITLAFPNVAAFKLALKREREGPTTEFGPVSALENVADRAKFEAAIAQCVQKGEERENRFNTLRDVPPEAYCINFARTVVALSNRRTQDRMGLIGHDRSEVFE